MGVVISCDLVTGSQKLAEEIYALLAGDDFLSPPRYFRSKFDIASELKFSSVRIKRSVDGTLAAFVLYRNLGFAKEILYLMTARKLRGQGYMRSLMSVFIASLASEELIWLEVRADNIKAQQLYKSLGFNASGRRKNYYSDGGSAICYEWNAGPSSLIN